MISIRCMVVWKSFFLAVTLIAAIGVTGEGQNLSVYASMLASPERRQQYRDEISKRLNELKSAIQNSASIAAQSNLPLVVEERIKARFELARYLIRNMESDLKQQDHDAVFFARRAIRDLEIFERYFRDEIAYGRDVSSFHEPKMFSVKEFGAKGDGESNDAPAFHAALRAIEKLNGNPAELLIPRGKYLFQTLTSAEQTRNLFGDRTFRHYGPNDFSIHNIHFLINSLSNLTIRGETPDTELLFVQREIGTVIAGCDNLTLKNLTLRYLPKTHMQGTVVSSDDKTKSLVVDIDEGYPLPGDPVWKGISVCCTQGYDEDGKLDKKGSDIYWRGQYEVLGNRRYRLTYHRAVHPGVEAGIRICFPIRKNWQAMLKIERSRFCTLENVTIFNSGAAACMNRESYVTSFIDCKIIPAAGSLMSGAADACFNVQNIIGPYMKNCIFRNFGDDGLNVLGYGENIYKRNGSILTVQSRPRLFDGNELSIDDVGRKLKANTWCYVVDSNTGKIIGDGRVKQIHRVFREGKFLHAELEVEGDFLLEEIRTAEDLYPGLTYDKMPSGKSKDAPDQLYFFQESGIGTVVVGCLIENNRHNGLTIQAPNVLIENNRLYHASFGGVVISAYANGWGKWREGPPAYNVIVRNNEVKDAFYAFCTWYWMRNNEAVATPFRHILFENNRFRDCENGFFICNANELRMKENQFSGNGVNRIRLSVNCLSKNDMWNQFRLTKDTFRQPELVRGALTIKSDLPVPPAAFRLNPFTWSQEKGILQFKKGREFFSVIVKPSPSPIGEKPYGAIQAGFYSNGLASGTYEMKIRVRVSHEVTIQFLTEFAGGDNKWKTLHSEICKLLPGEWRELKQVFSISEEAAGKRIRCPELFLGRVPAGTVVDYTLPEIQRLDFAIQRKGETK